MSKVTQPDVTSKSTVSWHSTPPRPRRATAIPQKRKCAQWRGSPLSPCLTPLFPSLSLVGFLRSSKLGSRRSKSDRPLLSHEALGESFHFSEAEFSSFYFSEVSERLDCLPRRPFMTVKRPGGSPSAAPGLPGAHGCLQAFPTSRTTRGCSRTTSYLASSNPAASICL